MSSKKINLDTAKKEELRSLCKKQGVKGYGKLSNDGMRAALRALIETDPNYQTTGPKKDAPKPVVTTPADDESEQLEEERDLEQNPDAPEHQKDAPAPVVITTPAREPLVLTGVMSTDREIRNGVKRPAPESICGKVWAALDSLHAAGVVPTAKDMRELSVAKQWNENNSLTEMYIWRRWQGVAKPQRAPKLLRGSEEEMIPYTA